MQQIGEWLVDILRTVIFFFDRIIYSLMGGLYRIFMSLGLAKFDNMDFVQDMFKRFTLILGIFMLFRITISLVQMIVDPDMINNKDKGVGNIIKRMCISVVLLAFMPRIFTMAYKIQDVIMNDGGGQVIANLILGGETTDTDFAVVFPMRVFNTFFVGRATIIEDVNRIGEYAEDLNDKDENGEYRINYQAPISTAVGLVLCYVFLVYSIQIAIRVAKLFFLQAIAPIPVLSYINPGDDKLKKWAKDCVNTYLDLFLRLGSIFFVALLVSKIDEIQLNPEYSDVEGWTKVGIYVGLFLFAKKIPELVKEILGVQGDYTMHTKEGKKVGSFVGGAVVGGITGGITGAVTGHGWGRLTSGFGGLFKGVGAGAKGSGFGKNMKGIYDSRKAVAQKQLEYKRAGSSVWGRMGARMGFDANASADNDIAIYQDWNDHKKAIYDIANDNSAVKAAKAKYDVTGSTADYAAYKSARDKFINKQLADKNSATYKHAAAADKIARSNQNLSAFKNMTDSDYIIDENSHVTNRTLANGNRVEEVRNRNYATFTEYDSSGAVVTSWTNAATSTTIGDRGTAVNAASDSIKADESYRQAQADQKAVGGKK